MAEKIKILGGGPAGLSAAIHLARAGYDVTVHEKRAAIGARFCGDLQGLENWSTEGDVAAWLRSSGIAGNFDCTPFCRVSYTDGRSVSTFESDRPLFYLVRRGSGAGSLDSGLALQAAEAGVRIELSSSLPREEADLIATGPGPVRPAAIARGIIFETDAADTAINLLDSGIPGRGYSYLLSAGGKGCLCTVLFDRFREAEAAFRESSRRLAEIAPMTMANPRSFGGYCAFTAAGSYTEGGRPVAGEAAGLQDFLAGFGIRTAISSGILAARSLAEGFDYPSAAAAVFDPYRRAGVVNRYLWEKDGAAGFPLLMRTMGRPDAAGVMRRLFSFCRPQQLLYPLARRHCRKRYPRVMA